MTLALLIALSSSAEAADVQMLATGDPSTAITMMPTPRGRLGADIAGPDRGAYTPHVQISASRTRLGELTPVQLEVHALHRATADSGWFVEVGVGAGVGAHHTSNITVFGLREAPAVASTVGLGSVTYAAGLGFDTSRRTNTDATLFVRGTLTRYRTFDRLDGDQWGVELGGTVGGSRRR
jgi:hypothetical protein